MRRSLISFWQEKAIAEKVISILRDATEDREGHHFGRPFLTAYQIAIELARRHPDIVAKQDWPVGGAGAGERNSWAQYLARRLSQLVRDNPDGPVEGGFLSDQHLRGIKFVHGDEIIHSSLTGTGFGLSMFRLRGEDLAEVMPSAGTRDFRAKNHIADLTVEQWRETISASNARAMPKRHQYPPHEGAFLLHCCTFQELTCSADCFCRKVGNDGVWTLRPDLAFDAFLDAFANLWVTGLSSFKNAVQDPRVQTAARWRYGMQLLREVSAHWSDWDGQGHSLPELASCVRRCFFCDDAFDLITPFVETIRGLPGDKSDIYTSKLVSQLFYDIAVPFDSSSKELQKCYGYDPSAYGSGSMQSDVRIWLQGQGLSIPEFRRLDDAPTRYWRPGERPEGSAGTACSRVLDKMFYG
jgi:hypothetical protein